MPFGTNTYRVQCQIKVPDTPGKTEIWGRVNTSPTNPKHIIANCCCALANENEK